jgi:hypothetical protein
MIKSMINDRLQSNVYYVFDTLSNIYSLEIFWINQIENKQTQLIKTNVQHLIKSNSPIEQFGLVQTNHRGQCLALITKSQKVFY